MRPIDLAREHGLSTQAVRNYERAGVLPPAARGRTGYRTYTERHARALRAFLALVGGHGHAGARAIMSAAVEGRLGAALELIDASHADLLAQRRTLDDVERALAALAAAPRTGQAGAPGEELPIGALAHRLRRHPATLRRWERAGLLRPRRDAAGQRRYTGDDVRDALLVGQLRRGGYPLAAVRPLLDALRAAGPASDAGAALADRRAALDARARAMLHGAACLHAYGS